LPPELLFSAQICTKSFYSFVGFGFAPYPTGEAYSAPPGPLAVFRVPTSKGEGRGKGREERRGEGREGKERRREGGSSSFSLGRKRKVGASAHVSGNIKFLVQMKTQQSLSYIV